MNTARGREIAREKTRVRNLVRKELSQSGVTPQDLLILAGSEKSRRLQEDKDRITKDIIASVDDIAGDFDFSDTSGGSWRLVPSPRGKNIIQSTDLGLPPPTPRKKFGRVLYDELRVKPPWISLFKVSWAMFKKNHADAIPEIEDILNRKDISDARKASLVKKLRAF